MGFAAVDIVNRHRAAVEHHDRAAVDRGTDVLDHMAGRFSGNRRGVIGAGHAYRKRSGADSAVCVPGLHREYVVIGARVQRVDRGRIGDIAVSSVVVHRQRAIMADDRRGDIV